MGLITKEVEICLSSNSQKYYEDLGYCIPKETNKSGRETVKNGTYIKVKTCDLPKNSHCKVDVLCDCCGDKFTVRYAQYLNNTNKHDGKYMCSSKKVIVGNRRVNTTDITYEDLIILYKQYIDVYGEAPVFSKCDIKHNMPQGRIINRVIAEEGITYNDFLLQFGKVSHVRTESKNYDFYVQRFKEVSDKLGHAIIQQELFNNSYGLPNPNWFVKYCPDEKVKTYDDFVQWCGYESNKLKKDDEMIGQKLIELENKLGRHITKNDITLENVGFSEIVVARVYGSLNKAKKKLGLLPTPPVQPLPFEYYKKRLDETLENIKSHTNRDIISWCDIESELNNPYSIEHKTLTKSFKREGIDIFAYIKSKGFMMNPNNFSFHYTFDDGERVVSSMEYEFSEYLRSLGYEYGKDYFRDVLYKTFSNEKTKMNCDYKIMVNGVPLYVEIAGIIYNCKENGWRNHTFPSKQEKDYQQKMLKKEQRLVESGQHFLFLFKSEMFNNHYRSILNNKINEIRREVA